MLVERKDNSHSNVTLSVVTDISSDGFSVAGSLECRGARDAAATYSRER